MSGHNKWSKIKHKKGANDAKKGKIYSKILRELGIALRNGSPDSPGVQLVIAKARAAGMPLDSVKRAIDKATDPAASAAYEEACYEGYGPGGVAVIIEALTDNKNRTVSDIRHILGRHNGSVAASGSTLWQFKTVGQLSFDGSSTTEDKLMEALLDAGADDIDCSDPETFWVSCAPEALSALREAAEKAKLVPTSVGVNRVAANLVQVPKDKASQVLKLLEALEDHDDVKAVYSNMDIPDDLAASLG